MRNIFLSLMVLCAPIIVSAQQKSNSQEQLRKEMEEMRTEMQAKMKALQDSVKLLRQQLSERDAEKNSESWFRLYSPFTDQQRSELEDALKLKEWSYQYQLPQEPLMPAAPPAQPNDFHFEMPPMPEVAPAQPYDFYFNVPDEKKMEREYRKHYNVAPCPDEKTHKHEWMKGLPFYDWFNK